MTALGRAIGCSRGDRFAWSTARKVTCPSSLAVSDCNLIQRNDRNLIQHKTPNKTTPTSGRVPRRGSPSGDSQLRADSPPDSTPPGRVEWWEGGCEAGWSGRGAENRHWNTRSAFHGSLTCPNPHSRGQPSLSRAGVTLAAICRPSQPPNVPILTLAAIGRLRSGEYVPSIAIAQCPSRISFRIVAAGPEARASEASKEAPAGSGRQSQCRAVRATNRRSGRPSCPVASGRL